MARLLMMTDLSESYATKLLQGIIQYSHEHEPWVVAKIPLSFRDANQLKTVAEIATHWRADAIIGQFRSFEDARIFQERGIIPVAQDYKQVFPGIINITGDYQEAGRMAARYFLERGLRNFAFYGLRSVVWSDGRREGFAREIEEATGLPLRKVDIREIKNFKTAWWYNTDKLVHWLRALPKPAGIFCCDDRRAYNILEACASSRLSGLRIPEDILVLGVDDDETVCSLCLPQLSSVALDVEKAGYQTARLIEEVLRLPPGERKEAFRDIVVHPTHIVTRRSTDILAHQNPYVARVLAYIGGNLDRRIRIEDLLELVPMSRRSFETTFSGEMGMSIYQYILHSRVDRMKELMDSGVPPQKAAMELGMEYKALSRNFKRLTGLSPREYALRAGM